MEEPAAQVDCPFCNWAPDTPFVYEEQLAVALIDRRPINRYHILVVPRMHYQAFVEMPDELVSHLYRLTKGCALILPGRDVVAGATGVTLDGT